MANRIAIAINVAIANGWHPEMAHSTPLLTQKQTAGFSTHLQSCSSPVRNAAKTQRVVGA